MDLTNKQVLHKSFGKGSIVDCNDSYLLINFKSGNKKFIYPDAFGDYLKLVDKKAADSVDKILQVQERERKIEEARIEEEKAQELEEHQRKVRIEKLLKGHKIHATSQVVFNCKKEELDSIFTDWKISTGTIKSGVNKGKINKLIRVHQNSVCLITSREAGRPEKERYIKGFYMVEENFIGRLCEDGFIPAHPEYRIKLTEEESKKMPFWKYYINTKYPNNMTWNSGGYRYFDNIWMAQILKDMLALKGEQEDSEIYQQFYDYFCLLNLIDEKELPKPDGPLTRLAVETA